MLDYIKDELFKTLTQFINEIELSFEYIPVDKIKEINEKINQLRNDSVLFSNFAKETYEHLKNFEDSFRIVMSGQKYKSDKLNFLNDISFFDLKFDAFRDESKNTKKSLVKYLYNIYMAVALNMEDASEQLLEFIQAAQAAQAAQMSEATSSSSTSKNRSKNARSHKLGHLGNLDNLSNLNNFGNLGNLGNMKGMKGMQDVMASLLGNKEIMSLATEISAQIKTDNLNPMSMLSGLMSGKVDGQLGNLMGRIQEKVESKMNSGEIDKAAFEEQAKNIFEKVQETDLKNLFPKV
jgi:hypothetical protein